MVSEGVEVVAVVEGDLETRLVAQKTKVRYKSTGGKRPPVGTTELVGTTVPTHFL